MNICIPDLKFRVAFSTPTIHGNPNSRATTAPVIIQKLILNCYIRSFYKLSSEFIQILCNAFGGRVLN